jgi:hypothetical protein
MFKIISRGRYNELIEKEGTLHELIEYKVVSKPILNCGYKSCNFQTTDAKGLKIHRSRVHRKK